MATTAPARVFADARDKVSVSGRRRSCAQNEAALFARYRATHDPAARDELVRRYLPLVRHLASRYEARAEREDLEQVAAMGLLKAIERYEPERRVAFASFAAPTISGELKRYFRDLGWTIRVPRELQDLRVRLAGLSGEL